MGTSKKRFTKADAVAAFLAQRNVPAVFQLSGGMIAFLTDSIATLGKTPIVNTRHEQAAGFAAEGATRINRTSAVAMGTSGPGATNLITAIASSYFDSVPTIFITGQVNQHELRDSQSQRQNGFQELDVVNLVKGITKYAISIDSETDLIQELNKCWVTANSGRPGPVLIDIPIDVQQEEFFQSQHNSSSIGALDSKPYENLKIEVLLGLVKDSSRPIFLLGGGIQTSGSVESVRRLIEETGIPAVHSLMGIDVLPSSSSYRIGMLGSYGNRWANSAVNRADLIIALGTRLDVRQTGNDRANFQKNKKIFRVDIDESELNGRITADVSVNATLNEFIESLDSKISRSDSSDWISSILDEKKSLPQEFEQSDSLEFNPDRIMKWISSVNCNASGYIVDVGQHQMWAAQSLELGPKQRFITSGGLGAMGFALPAAIGATYANSGRWVVIAGDGCTQLSLAELQTIIHYNLPITICVMNNLQHGMVAQFQETNMDSRFVATRDGYSAPNFCKIAEAFGVVSHKIENYEDMRALTEEVSSWDEGALLLEFKISRGAKALPKMGVGDQD